MIARMLGKSVAELDKMTPGEYFLWEQFVARYPPLELEVKRLQVIMAEIWATLASFASGFSKTPQTHYPHETAPWLYKSLTKSVIAEKEETKEEIQERRLQLARRLGGQRH